MMLQQARENRLPSSHEHSDSRGYNMRQLVKF